MSDNENPQENLYVSKRQKMQIVDSEEENGIDHEFQEENGQNGDALGNGNEKKKIKSEEDESYDIKQDEEVEIADEEIEEAISESQSENGEKEKKKKQKIEAESDEQDYIFVEKLPKGPHLKKLKEKLEQKLKIYKARYFQENFENQNKKSKIHDNAIPICADIRQLDFQKLRDSQQEIAGKLFDVIMMDPPWQLSSAQPSRGVAIGYSTLTDENIGKMNIDILQTDGFIFIWTINAKYRTTCKLIEQWGYKLVDEIIWVKKTVNGKIAKSHGFYLQHAKENCLIGVKGDTSKYKKSVQSDIIFSERRGQSQKPEQIYEYIEELVPNGNYLEIFGRRNNVRENWVTIGNEL